MMSDITMPPNYWTGKGLLELGVPWLTPISVRAIEYILEPSFSVLEFGAGGSTIFFSRRCQRVVSWEHDGSWRKSVDRQLKLLGLTNCHLTGDLIEAQASGVHDLVLVDSNGATTDRQSIFQSSLGQVRRGGWMVLDNYGRYDIGMLASWPKTMYDDPHWSGRGTMIAQRP